MKDLELVVKILDEKLAEDLVIIDFEGKGSIADCFIICTAKNERHSDSLVDYLKEGLESKVKIHHIDDEDPAWQIIDLGDILVHIFLKETRERYQLERLWSDYKVESL